MFAPITGFALGDQTMMLSGRRVINGEGMGRVAGTAPSRLVLKGVTNE